MTETSVAIVGAGINGTTAAIELTKRGHRVKLLDPGPLPHPLAASTDISKVVRMEYGADEDYMALAEQAIEGWHAWNQEFGVELYHQTGMLFLRQSPLKRGDYEYESLRLLRKRGHKPERLKPDQIRARFPAWNADHYVDGFFDPEGGYAESGRVVARLVEKAKSLGVELLEGDAFAQLDETDGRVRGVITAKGERIAADQVLMAVGAWTNHLLPQTAEFLRSVGQPVFHLKPKNPDLFRGERFPVFAADTSNTGYYGFPVNRDGVLKIARHATGREMHPESEERAVTPEEEKNLREFLAKTFAELAEAPIVYTRVCLYSDTYDGHFWIAPDPDHPGLVVAAGDSGHGFKFAPILGGIIADAVEGNPNPILEKFRWRPEVRPHLSEEASRHQARKRRQTGAGGRKEKRV
jgi:glycine/D-amino acid oxidase-like deaminating enzyme